MKKRIIICADSTWNAMGQDHPTNVLKLCNSIAPVGDDGVLQKVFHDWRIGAYSNDMVANAVRSMEKNIIDDYRYIVKNYEDGDELFFFGFSKGAMIVRCLCDFIQKCGIVKNDDSELIRRAFELYRNPSRNHQAASPYAKAFRNEYSHPSRNILFAGFFEHDSEFQDMHVQENIEIARQALAVDGYSDDSTPTTMWELKEGVDIKKVCFTDSDEANNAESLEEPMQWLVREAGHYGLSVDKNNDERYLKEIYIKKDSSYDMQWG